MASSVFFRNLTRGPQLLKSPACRNAISCLMRPDAMAKTYKLTPVSSSVPVPEYFRARRGPFTPEQKQGNHMMFSSTHWKVERVLAVSMLGIMPTALFIQNPLMEFIFTTSIFMHAFWAFDHVLSDYVQKFFPLIHYVWYAISIVAFAGLMHFNYNDVGVLKAIAMLWKI